MNKNIKNKWLRALQSGKYMKARGTLRNQLSNGTYTYCCLGVLANLVDPKAQTSDWYEYGTLPDNIKDYVELSDGQETRLISLNDHKSGWNYVINCIKKEL